MFILYTGLFISPSGILKINCATTKTDTAERSISMDRESLQVFVQPYSCSLARVVDFWGILTNASRTRSTVSADGPRRPIHFAVHRQPLCWNFMYHSQIVLSVGGSVWYMIRNLCCTVTIDSVFGKFQDTERILIHCERHFSSRLPPSGGTCKYTKAPSTKKKLGEIPYPLICSFLPCLSWLLRSRVRKSRRDL